MSRTAAIILALVAFGLGMGAGVGGFLWATGGNAEPSRDASEVAGTLSLDEASEVDAAADDASAEDAASDASNDENVSLDLTALNTKIDALAAEASADVPTSDEVTLESLEAKIDAIAVSLAADTGESSVPEPTATEEVSAAGEEASTADTSASASTAADSGEERILYRITTEESEARFKIDEVLSGTPTEVIGITDQVAGDVIIDFANPDTSQLGTIAVNARTLATDNNFRNQAIRSRILNSSQDAYEFITFTPTDLIGLPDSVSVGDTVEFQIVGDLQIRDSVQEVTFDATVEIVSEDRIEGSAVTLVMYRDFGISIQTPPQVADVGEEVDLEIDFVATRVES